MMIVIFIALTSCEKDDNNGGDNNKAACLLTKATWSNSEDNRTESLTFKYDSNNRCIKVESNDFALNIEYNSNYKVSKISSSDYESAFTWTASTLTKISKYKEGEDWIASNYKIVYNLDADGKVTKEQYYNKQEDSSWIASDRYYKYTWLGGNLVQQECWNTDDSSKKNKSLLFNKLFGITKTNTLKSVNDKIDYTVNYEFDDKHNAFSSVGMSWDVGIEIEAPGQVTKNNVKKASSGDSYVIYTYEYNDNGFPTKVSHIDGTESGGTATYTTVYEYNCN